jgi:hypothetical protein
VAIPAADAPAAAPAAAPAPDTKSAAARGRKAGA